MKISVITLFPSVISTYLNTSIMKRAQKKGLIQVEVIDLRFIDKYVDEEISVGDYVLTGGELPALTVIDATVRLLKGVLEKEEATRFESFENNLLEHPHYTRPENFEGEKVPEVLTSGNNQKIADWKKEKSLEKTTKIRRDLLDLN